MIRNFITRAFNVVIRSNGVVLLSLERMNKLDRPFKKVHSRSPLGLAQAW